MRPAMITSTSTGTNFRFASRQRGDRAIQETPAATPTNTPTYVPSQPAGSARPDSMIYNPFSTGPHEVAERQSELATVTGLEFHYRPCHTFGYLNLTYGQPINPQTPSAYTLDPSPFAGVPDPTDIGWTGNYTPTPLVMWYNRPFLSPMEIMSVPASSPGRFGAEFLGQFNPTTPNSSRRVPQENAGNPFNAYDPTSSVASSDANYFRYALNFHQGKNYNTTPPAPGGTPASNSADHAPNLFRLFDFLGMKSPFVGSQQYLPNVAAPAATERQAPYNTVSLFRDQGRININTMTEEVWQAIDGAYQRGHDPMPSGHPNFWAEIETSRRGYDLTNANINPSPIGNPFRSSFGGDMMPQLYPSGTSAPGRLRQHPDRENGLFRPGIQPAGTTINNPLFRASGVRPWDSPDLHAYHRNLATSRLPNMTTTHSNVFATWITVGYFQVIENQAGPITPRTGAPLQANPATPTVIQANPYLPDGYRLGRELGSDLGATRRNRAFYIIDRSIPVGFEPGVNHNVEDTILLRRYID